MERPPLILKRMNERFGFDFILINERPDGKHFAHNPVISAETIGLQLAPLMQPLRADVGFQFDVDSDRVGIATERGRCCLGGDDPASDRRLHAAALRRQTS